MALTPAHLPISVRQLFDRDSWTYSYLLIDRATQQAIIIDPVREQLDRDLSLIKELGLELLYILETHIHADHITSAGLLRQKSGAKIGYSAAAQVHAIDIAINDGDILRLGDHSLRAITTPGHTDGCISYYIDGLLFSGDALLIRGCGRTDFQQGNPVTLYHSITQKLFVLPAETIVYPGHDYRGFTSSTIAEEQRWNSRLGQQRTLAQFVEIMQNLKLDLPKRINEAVPANLAAATTYDPHRYINSDFSMADLYNIWRTLPANELIVDSRTPQDYAQSHVPGAMNIPFGSEEQFLDTYRAYQRVYLYCRSGRRAQTAFTSLTLMGLDNLVCVSHSGMPEWLAAGYPVEQ